jgi:hypothetical protein
MIISEQRAGKRKAQRQLQLFFAARCSLPAVH